MVHDRSSCIMVTAQLKWLSALDIARLSRNERDGDAAQDSDGDERHAEFVSCRSANDARCSPTPQLLRPPEPPSGCNSCTGASGSPSAWCRKFRSREEKSLASGLQAAGGVGVHWKL